MGSTSARTWAREEFGTASLGDARRTARLVRIGERAAAAPSGKITEVFCNADERQAAYDFLENPATDHSAILRAMQAATAARCAKDPFVFVPIDGTSLALTDTQRVKGFGAVGSWSNKGQGLQVIDAIAVSPKGVPRGVSTLVWWTRDQPIDRSRPSCARKVKDRETQRWLDGLTDVSRSLEAHAPTTRAWFQLDRGADASPVLRHLSSSGHWFTVRASFNRRLRTRPTEPRRYLRDAFARVRPLCTATLHVSPGPHRTERDARMEQRATTVTLDLLNPWTKSHSRLPVNVVWVRETGRVPNGEKRIEWLLLTNHPVDTAEDVQRVVFGYAQRWRIEDVHRTWKSGACNVERMQLRAKPHALKWATILAAVALRIERLKHLSRTEPNLPASVELTADEIAALILLKRQHQKKTEDLPTEMPTVGVATQWIAELGGYTGKSSGGPPGSATLGRGLVHLEIAAGLLERLRVEGKLR
jgi:hypothetical protein